ncbi:hypothetical protein D9M71_799320 [compost metagenome]
MSSTRCTASLSARTSLRLGISRRRKTPATDLPNRCRTPSEPLTIWLKARENSFDTIARSASELTSPSSLSRVSRHNLHGSGIAMVALL